LKSEIDISLEMLQVTALNAELGMAFEMLPLSVLYAATEKSLETLI
jgi:hypothetical protein